MKRNIAYLLTLGILIATSCSNDVEELDTATDTAIVLTATIENETRAAEGLQESFTAGDEVGVYIAKEKDGTTAYLAENKLFKVKSNGKLEASDGTRYIYPGESYETRIYAYKPYSGNGVVNNVFSVAADQTTEANYIASDVLWGEPKNGNPVMRESAIDLEFEHRCAKLVVNLTVADGLNLKGGTLCTSEVVTGMKLSDIASGTFLATTDKGKITFGNLTDAATQTHVAVLVPQNVPAGTELVRITLADASARPLAMRLPSQLSLEAGKKCVLNVTARRSGLELDNTKITPWTSSEQYDGEVSKYKKLDLSTLTADTRIIENVTAIGTTDYKLTLAEGVTFRMVDVTIKNQIKCEGNATIRLIGTNVISCTTEKRSGIEAGPTDATLTIDGSGRIEVSGGANASAIGSGDGSSCGAITINGGTIIATGVDKGAGIGSGYYYSTCGAITINGGTITATGGDSGAGIGSGYVKSTCGAITINGGTIIATGGDSGAGIGSGYGNSTCGVITISGGIVDAKAGSGGAGIGSGIMSSCGNMNIGGGRVTATGGNLAAGIGCGSKGSCGAITITGLTETLTAKTGKSAACIGLGWSSTSCGEIKVTNCKRVVLDDSSAEIEGEYFNPKPTDNSGSHFYDEDGTEISFK